MKWFFGLFSKLWRLISPAAQNAFTQMIATIAEDLVRSYIANHPNAVLNDIMNFLLELLKNKLGINTDVAYRALASAYHKVTGRH